MADGYGGHADFWVPVVSEADERQERIEEALTTALAAWIELHAVPAVRFSDIAPDELARAVLDYPMILKPLIASANIAARAIERDLGIRNVNTYAPRLTDEQALAIAAYVLPFLPEQLDVPAMSHLDRSGYIDKEIRLRKGRWEAKVRSALNLHGRAKFTKRKFTCEDDQFELDAASPTSGGIEVGIDVKRIEARRDIHKRTDEIVNKASKFKSVYPEGQFGAVVYYPFPSDHGLLQRRVLSQHVAGVVFASETDESIDAAVESLLAQLDYLK